MSLADIGDRMSFRKEVDATHAGKTKAEVTMSCPREQHQA
jgi:hypothetical protein